MKKYLLLTMLLLNTGLSAEDNAGKFKSSIGIGEERQYNYMFFPFEFKGINYSMNLEWQIPHSKWISDVKFYIHYASIFANNSVVNIPVFNSSELCFGAKLQYQIMRKVLSLSDNHFRLFIGGNVELQSEYETFLDVATSISRYFLSTDLSLGASLYAEYNFGWATISNNFSMPLLTGSFYPHYQYAPFYYTGKASSYFTFAPIGILNRLSNYFTAEFPITIHKKSYGTVFLSYNFNYEYSTIRDNVIRRIGHLALVGFSFRIYTLGVK
jgi:hypothetical protein